MYFFEKGSMNEFRKVSYSTHPSAEYFCTECVGMLTIYVLNFTCLAPVTHYLPRQTES